MKLLCLVMLMSIYTVYAGQSTLSGHKNILAQHIIALHYGKLIFLKDGSRVSFLPNSNLYKNPRYGLKPLSSALSSEWQIVCSKKNRRVKRVPSHSIS